MQGQRPAYFEVETWRVITSSAAEDAVSEAIVKLRAGGSRIIAVGEGNGPVNALDHALREAIGQAIMSGQRDLLCELYLDLATQCVRAGDLGQATRELAEAIDLVTMGEGGAAASGPRARCRAGPCRTGRRGRRWPAPSS